MDDVDGEVEEEDKVLSEREGRREGKQRGIKI